MVARFISAGSSVHLGMEIVSSFSLPPKRRHIHDTRGVAGSGWALGRDTSDEMDPKGK